MKARLSTSRKENPELENSQKSPSDGRPYTNKQRKPHTDYHKTDGEESRMGHSPKVRRAAKKESNARGNAED